MISIQNYKLYLRNDFRQILIHNSGIQNNTLHDLTLTKITVASFMGPGSFLIGYSNHYMK